MRDVNDQVKEIKLSKRILYCPGCGAMEDEEGFNCSCPAELVSRNEFERAMKEAEKVFKKYKRRKQCKN